MQPARHELRALTGLRGLAACYVVLYHYFQQTFPTGLVSKVVLHGYLAVDLFFVLSGFVMALSYRNAFSDGFVWLEYRNFLVKRLARIYPLFFVASAAAGIVAATLYNDPPTLSLSLENVFLIQSWGLGGRIDGPGWSISTEFAAYLLFPAFLAVTVSGGWHRAALSALVAILGLLALAHLPSAWLNQVILNGEIDRFGPLDIWGTYQPFLLLRCFAGFTLGLVAFRLFGVARVRRAAAAPIVSWTIIPAIGALLFVKGSDVLVVVLCVPLILALASGTSRWSSLLAWGPIHWLGEVSYSIYLIHIVAKDLLERSLRTLLISHGMPHAYTAAVVAVILPMLGLAALSFYLVEKPAREAGRMIIAPRKVKASVAALPP